MTAPYFQDEWVTLYHGDCREVTGWLAADVLVTDPPYGRGWKQGTTRHNGKKDADGHAGIAGDEDTSLRDWTLTAWGDRLSIVFGDLMLAPPAGTRQVGIYRKPTNAGTKGTFGGLRRDAEAFYLIGPWPAGLNGRSSIVGTGSRTQASQASCQARYGHPHAKPVDVMETLIAACPPGRHSGPVRRLRIADPFAGSGSTLVAARNLGRPAIGVELEERYCEQAALRLSQMTLDL